MGIQQQQHLYVDAEQESESLIPSSLESEYEQVREEIRKQDLLENYSFSYAMISSDIRDAFNRDQFNLKTLRVIDGV